MTDISKKTFVWVIIGLILLRFLLVILVMNNVPFTDMQLGGFRPHFNESYMPDEQKFFDIGKGLVAGKIINSSIPSNLGYGLFLAPFIYFLKAENTVDIAKPIFIFQEFMLFPIALILVALIAIYLFKSRFWAAISTGLFAVYPWLILGFGKLIHYCNAVPAFHHQLWIIIQSDYISALFVYLTVFLFLKWYANLMTLKSDNKVIWLGIITGAAMLVRMTNILLFLIIIAALLYFKRWKPVILYASSAAIVYLPQVIFNWLAFKTPWNFGYRFGPAYENWFKISNLWLNFSHFSPRHYFLWFLAVAVFFLIIYILGFKYLKKNNVLFTRIAAGWFWSYLLLYGTFTFSTQSLRYFLPAIPVFIYFFVGSLANFKEKNEKK